MHDRSQGDPCPECATPFDTRPDAYVKRWKLDYPIALEILAMLVMPFIAIFAVIFLIPAFFAYNSLKAIPDVYRVPMWASQRIRLCYKLLVACLIEFWVLMLISTLWPEALNWW